MRPEILDIIQSFITESEVKGKLVLEAGSRDINGSARSVIEKLNPASYTGIDIEEGPGVDLICNIYKLVDVFGENSFDIVVCMETMEHVKDWVVGVSNLKRVLKPGGILIFSVPSIGRGLHEYPYDYWRFQMQNLEHIFSDMEITNQESIIKGCILKAMKPVGFEEKDLSEYRLYSILTKRRE